MMTEQELCELYQAIRNEMKGLEIRNRRDARTIALVDIYDGGYVKALGKAIAVLDKHFAELVGKFEEDTDTANDEHQTELWEANRPPMTICDTGISEPF